MPTQKKITKKVSLSPKLAAALKKPPLPQQKVKANIIAKSFAVKDNIITIDEMMQHPDDSVYILNNTGRAGTQYPQRIRFNLPFELQGKAVNIVIDHSWLPLLVEGIDKESLLKSTDFRKLYTRGVLQIVNPDIMDKVYASQDAQDELARVSNINIDNTSVGTKKQVTISSNLKVLLDSDSGSNPRTLLAHIRNNKNLTSDDYRYIIEHVKDNSIVRYAREQLEAM